MHIIVRHEGQEVGRVFTAGGLTTDRTLYLAGIDLNETEGGIPKWDYGKFEFESLSDREYAAILLGSATSETKAESSRRNGHKGGRPKKEA